jgi:hypothetical protein
MAPWFSTSDTECHPGLYLWPTKGEAEKWLENCSQEEKIVKVRALAADVHKAVDKWRCKKFTVVETITRKEEEENNAKENK